jgi:hypothetical protein
MAHDAPLTNAPKIAAFADVAKLLSEGSDQEVAVRSGEIKLTVTWANQVIENAEG